MRNFIITVNGTSYEVGVEEVGASTAPKTTFVSASAPAPAPVKSASAPAAPSAAPAAAPKASAANANGEKVLSPFPGLIKQLLVAEGTTVAKDQPILVLEAMKMDNEITAPVAGVVSFAVAKGANVESDSVLAVIG
ncbi:MAG: biotin/lipoyl-containing protein [Candidatus Borkfalkiaceae bacterium]|nr:biotin/lipoyl-binding protein [Clostridia bacterium]MDY6223071.1 biotin/lipoyl-containing protein [Christensenellaceae bacterium]